MNAPRGLLSQLLEVLHLQTQASAEVRRVMARYADAVERGEALLQTLEALSKIDEAINHAIEDIEARSLGKVGR